MKTLLSSLKVEYDYLKGSYRVEIRHLPDDCEEFLTECFYLFSLQGIEEAIANFRRHWGL